MLFLFSITWGSVSGWWLVLCLAAGIIYAWLLYRNPVSLNRVYRNALAVVRAITVTLIGVLLLSPLIKTLSYQAQKPLILIAQDNSSSVSAFKPSGFNAPQFVQQLAGLQQQLGSDYEVKAFHFDRYLVSGLSTQFNGKQTDIASAMHQLNELYTNQNIGAIVLTSDGLYNTGADPEQQVQSNKAIIYTVALGDTTHKRDLLIGNINYNKTALLGNNFMIEVLVEAYQCKAQNVHLMVAEDDRPVYSQNIAVNGNEFRKTIPIKLNADRKGIHRFTVSLTPLNNEITTVNNQQTIYIEVLDARQKVLLVYASPHPDVSVIKQSIEHNKNYEVKAITLDRLNTIKLSDYSLLILHQLAASSSRLLQQQVTSGRLPVWYIVGAQSNLGEFNQEQKALQINAEMQNMQEAFALPVNGFSAFTLSDSTQKKIAAFAPLLVPYGSYTAGSGAQVLFRQKIGNVSTPYPLFLFSKADNRAVAILAGEGLWRWQLSEYEAYGNHNATDELLSQSVQYLTANANRQRFRVYPSKNIFNENENILLNAELYNEALELVNTPEVSISLKSKSGKVYSYQFSRTGQSYQLDAGVLPGGEYNYTANTKIGNTPFIANGQFTVQVLNLENQQGTANHQLLKQMAKQSGGVMLLPSQFSQLAELIKHNDSIKTIEYEDRHYAEAIDTPWLLVLIIVLLSTEWIVRKREGEV